MYLVYVVLAGHIAYSAWYGAYTASRVLGNAPWSSGERPQTQGSTLHLGGIKLFLWDGEGELRISFGTPNPEWMNMSRSE